MSFAEIKEELPKLTEAERRELSSYLALLELQNDPEFSAELERRMSRMDQGQKISREDVLRMHQELLARGE